METVLLQINNEKAYQLLKSLEDLKLVKLLKRYTSKKKLSLADKYAGSLQLSDQEYDQFQQTLVDYRNEWNKNS
nr:hypothetical protein [uncultured Pedobacter sp.]